MTTLVAVAASAVALIPMWLIVEYLIVDAAEAAEAADLRRLADMFAPADPRDAMPPPRDDLPRRLSPTDLPARWDTAGLAAVELGSRARHASTAIAETAPDYRPLHLRLDITQEFKRIIGVEFGAQRCDSCTVGWDREPTHASCPGCSCPCTVVDEYAMAGGTR